MKLIDFDRYGNVVRFYIGENDLMDWYGDDWNDRPYEHNAGAVYDEYVAGYFDVAWDANFIVTEPADENMSKDDMKAQRAPMIVVTPLDKDTYRWEYNYRSMIGDKTSMKFYMGDDFKFVKNYIVASNGVVLCEHIKKLEPDYKDTRY